MLKTKQFTLAIVSLITLHCTSLQKEDDHLTEAARIHDETIALANRLKNQLNRLASDSLASPDSVRTWRAALRTWESNLIEIPGNEHHEGHEHHESTKTPELTYEQILVIHQELEVQLKDLEARITIKYK